MAVGRQDVRVLIVEDYPDTAESMGRFLAGHGCSVRVAANGEDALAVSQAWSPDIVFLDIGLPRLNGWDVARQLRGRAGGHALLVAVTGYGATEDYVRSEESGIDLHLTKPADPNLLVDLVQRFREVAYP